MLPAHLHIVEIRLLLRHSCLHHEQFLPLATFLEQIVNGHQDLSVFRGLLHLFRSDFLVFAHHPVFVVFKLLQLLLPLRYLIVELDFLRGGSGRSLGKLQVQVVLLSSQPLLLFLEVVISLLQGCVTGQDVIKLLELVLVLLLNTLQEGFELVH